MPEIFMKNLTHSRKLGQEFDHKVYEYKKCYLSYIICLGALACRRCEKGSALVPILLHQRTEQILNLDFRSSHYSK